MRQIIWTIIACLYALLCPLIAIEVRLIKEIHLQEKAAFLQRPSSFVKTADGLFVISDFQAGDLKLYRSSGELLKTFGRKGQGPDEFLGPFKLSFCAPLLGVVDIDRRMVFILNIKADGNLKTSQYFSCPGGAENISLSEDRVTVSGYYVDPHGVAWSVYQYVFTSKKIVPIFLRHEIFGFSSRGHYEKNFLKEVAPLGMKILCEQHHADAFAVWDANLRIFKKNIWTGEVKTFGQKTSRYVQPQNTKELEKAKKERNIKKVQEEIDKFSYILTIAVTNNLVILIYRDPKDQDRIVQAYDFSGNFLGETEIPSPAERGMFYVSKDEPLIHELSYEESLTSGLYKIRTYKMVLKMITMALDVDHPDN